MSGWLASWGSLEAASTSFCEARLDGMVAEPANAWSSAAYVAAGLWILRRAWHGRQTPLLLAGMSGVLVGLGSLALHATATYLGQFLDGVSMYLLSALVLTMALRRWLAWDTSRCLRHFAAVAIGSTALLALVPEGGSPVFGLEMGASIGLEGILWVRGQREVRSGALALAVATLAGGFVVWILDSTRAVCDPSWHVINGHAVWHVLTAGSLLAYARYQEQFYASGFVRVTPREAAVAECVSLVRGAS